VSDRVTVAPVTQAVNFRAVPLPPSAAGRREGVLAPSSIGRGTAVTYSPQEDV